MGPEHPNQFAKRRKAEDDLVGLLDFLAGLRSLLWRVVYEKANQNIGVNRDRQARLPIPWR